MRHTTILIIFLTLQGECFSYLAAPPDSLIGFYSEFSTLHSPSLDHMPHVQGTKGPIGRPILTVWKEIHFCGWPDEFFAILCSG